MALGVISLVACSHAWDDFDPRLGAASTGGATSASSSSQGSGASGSTTSGGLGGSANAGGVGNGGKGAGGAAGSGAQGGCGATGYSEEVTADAPVAYWRLGEAVGSLVASDELGASDGQALGGVTFGSPGVLAWDADTSATLDGTSGRIDIGDKFDFAGSVHYSVEA